MLRSSTNGARDKPCETRKVVIISGFLMKSPRPRAKKTASINPLLCLNLAAQTQQNWRKRFCVLYKLRKPGQTEVYLHYFKDRECKKFKGSVDLQSCHCVYEETETLNHRNVFGIETKWNGEHRTYLFSAETHEEMNQWLNGLAAALHMGVPVPDQAMPCTGSPPLSHFPPVSRPLFPSPSTSSPWSAQPSSGRDQRPPPLQAIPSHSAQSQSDEYKMDFSTVDPEDYYKLSPYDHAYVNLPDQSSDMANPATGDGYLVAVKVPQDADELDHLGNDLPPESKAPESPESDRQSRQSMYYNVWDLDTQPSAAVKEENASAAAAPQAASESQPPPPLQLRPLSVEESRRTSEGGVGAGRAVRRSQVISEYIVLPHLSDASSMGEQEQVEGSAEVTTTLTAATATAAPQMDREPEQPLPPPDSSAPPPPNASSDSASDSEPMLPTRSKPAAEEDSDDSDYSEDEEDSEEEEGKEGEGNEEEEENKQNVSESTGYTNFPPSEPENTAAPSLGLNGEVDIVAVANPIHDDDASSHCRSSTVLKETQVTANAQPTSTPPDPKTPELHYLDAKNLYFSNKNRKKTPPPIPAKPVHLRKRLSEQSSPVKPLASASAVKAEDAGADSDRIEYKELDPVTTCALEYVTNLITDTNKPT